MIHHRSFAGGNNAITDHQHGVDGKCKDDSARTSSERDLNAIEDGEAICPNSDRTRSTRNQQPVRKRRVRNEGSSWISSFYLYADSHFEHGVNRCLFVTNLIMVILIIVALMALVHVRDGK